MHVQNSSQNDIIKDILKKKNDVHWISDGTVGTYFVQACRLILIYNGIYQGFSYDWVSSD